MSETTETIKDEIMPDFLKDEELEIWKFYFPKIKQNLQDVDQHILAMFCISYARYKRDVRDPDKTSIEIERLFGQIMKLSSKLGLSPFDRTKLEASSDDDEDDSLFMYIGKK